METYLESTLHQLYLDMLRLTSQATSQVDRPNLILRRQLLHTLDNYRQLLTVFTADLDKIRVKLDADINLLESLLREQKS